MPGSNGIFSPSQFLDQLEGISKPENIKDFKDRIMRGAGSAVPTGKMFDEETEIDFGIN